MKILTLILFTSLSSWAYQNVTCWENDCLKNGWTRTDYVTSSYTDFMCYGTGCDSRGLIAGGNQNVRYYTQCKSKGCYIEGWYEVDRDTQALIANVECRGLDCLVRGWVAHTQNKSLLTQCQNQNCREEGWISQMSDGSYVQAVCKNKSCFKQGWIESK